MEAYLGHGSHLVVPVSVHLSPLHAGMFRYKIGSIRQRANSSSVDLGHILVSGTVEQNIELRQETFHNVSDAMLSADGQRPDPETPDEDELGAQGKGFEHIGCSANA